MTLLLKLLMLSVSVVLSPSTRKVLLHRTKPPHLEISVHDARNIACNLDTHGVELVSHDPELQQIVEMLRLSVELAFSLPRFLATMQRFNFDIRRLIDLSEVEKEELSQTVTRDLTEEDKQRVLDCIPEFKHFGKMVVKAKRIVQAALSEKKVTFETVNIRIDAKTAAPLGQLPEQFASLHTDPPVSGKRLVVCWIPLKIVENYPLLFFHDERNNLHFREVRLQNDKKKYLEMLNQVPKMDNWVHFSALVPGEAVIFFADEVPHGSGPFSNHSNVFDRMSIEFHFYVDA